jgi:hypothetical protein
MKDHKMPLKTMTEAATNPAVAVPVTTAGAIGNLLDALPHLVAAGWLIYIAVLISHKIWKWRQEWKKSNG